MQELYAQVDKKNKSKYEVVVFINNLAVKKAKEVKVGDIIEIRYLEKSDKFKVLQIPSVKSTPKSKMDEYVERIEG